MHKLSLIQYALVQKPHSGFSMSLACHVAFLFPPLRSLRGNWCCLFIIQGLNGSTMKICHSLSVMIALFHYRPSAGGSQVKSPLVLSTSYFLLPVSHHESLTNQLVTSYLLLFQFVAPCTFWKLLFRKTDIKYTWRCEDESWDVLFRRERMLQLFSLWVGWIKPRSYGWYKWGRLGWSSWWKETTSDKHWNRNATPLIVYLKSVIKGIVQLFFLENTHIGLLAES